MDRSRYQDKSYLRDSQYKDSGNLNARAQLHQRFSTAGQPWKPWVMGNLQLRPGDKVLECGCGPGWLWQENLANIPAGCQITLTDLSPGMVAEAEKALQQRGVDFRFKTADIQKLPFADDTFDVVVANHMLYHVPDIGRGLREVSRVLQPGGRLHAVTNGLEHMQELRQMRDQMMQLVGRERLGELFQLPFRLENGAALLAPHFAEVTLIPYEDELRVTEVEPLLAYALSADEIRAQISPAEENRLRQMLQEMMQRGGGAIQITKAVGMFVARAHT